VLVLASAVGCGVTHQPLVSSPVKSSTCAHKHVLLTSCAGKQLESEGWSDEAAAAAVAAVAADPVEQLQPLLQVSQQ